MLGIQLDHDIENNDGNDYYNDNSPFIISTISACLIHLPSRQLEGKQHAPDNGIVGPDHVDLNICSKEKRST